VPFNDRRNTGQGPEGIAEAMGASALAQAVEKVLALIETECGLTASRRRFGVASRLRIPRHGRAPAPDGTGGSLDVSSHLTDAPASLQEGDGNAASNRELDACAFGSHATLIGNIDLGL
jgi:hypothetical protein